MTRRIGIIGDGQLGMMLCEAAPPLDLETVMLAADAACPAAQQAGTVVVGAMDDTQALERLIDACEVITYEREDLPPAAIATLRDAEASGRLRCFPPLDCIEMLQDKVRQKRWYAENQLESLPFRVVDGSLAALQEAACTLGFPLVQKAPRGGFDGRGVQLLRSDADLRERAWPGETLLEQFAGAFREIAVLVVRGADGEHRHFGPVDMTFEPEFAVLDTVTAPAMISDAVSERAVDLAMRAITAMQGVGVFGVELFFLEGGKLFINEISPRVHNAGHYSLVGCVSTQFEQHLRAVSGLPLASTELRTPSAMKNILATPALSERGRTESSGHFAQGDDATISWYGKSPARLMRKLGHIAATADTPAEALALCQGHWQQIQWGQAVAQGEMES
ncbi:MAG: ATP-grasp domain-containing protein [Pseudomonadota bacterium]